MEALDGNAIAGLMVEIFGREMTAMDGECVHCGSVAQVAEIVVYLEAPGVVGRCRSCDGVLMVVVEAHSVRCVDLSGLAMLS
jgi:Family of unknown function (DUF6510)